MAGPEYVALSDVEHDGEVVLHHGDKITASVKKKLGDELLDNLYDDGVIVEEHLIPEHARDRPEGNTDRVGFRVPSLSEMIATQDRKSAEKAAKGEPEEVSTS